MSNNNDIMRAPAAAPQKQMDGPARIVETLLPEMAKALPQHVGRDRMARMLLTTFRKTPKLLSCNRASLMGGMLEVARLGLEPGHEVHLVPYGNECQVIVGYQGLVRLMYQSNYVTSIQTGVHREGDEWEVEFGLTPKLRHIPGANPGAMLHVYAIAHLRDGGYAFRVMTKAEVDKVKKNTDPWRKHYEAMAEKTVLRRLAKYIPQSPEMMAALRLDDRAVNFNAETGESDFIDIEPEPESRSAALPSGPEAEAIRERLVPWLEQYPAVLEQLVIEQVGGFTTLDEIRECDRVDSLIAADAWVFHNAARINGGAS